MLRVSRAEEWLHCAPTSLDMSTHGNRVLLRSAERCNGTQGISLATGISSQSAGAKALCLRLVMIPPGARGVPHYHAGGESAIYTVSGETEVWHGPGLTRRTVVQAGDFMYVPPCTPHLSVNRAGALSVSVVVRSYPDEQESVVIMELPRHLAALLTLPVANQA
jgi:uncharacterized RmlC-like cupin family protein